MGGYYERLVRSVKQALRNSLGPICLTFIQLQTILCEIEAVLNSRPLIYPDSDVNSSPILTPAHLLGMNPTSGLPTLDPDSYADPDYGAKLSSKDKLLSFWKKGEKHLATFWNLWRSHYLLSLRERPRVTLRQPHTQAHSTPVIGAIVHIREDRPRGSWPLAQIVELIKSSDGEIRSAKVRTAQGTILTRSITHLFPLECDLDLQSQTPNPPPDVSQALDPSAPVPTTPAPTRPQRQAASVARQRIQQRAQDDDSDHEDPSPETAIPSHSQMPLRFRGPQSTLFLMVALFLLINPASALQPLLCEARNAKVAFNIENRYNCSFTPGRSLEHVSHAHVMAYKNNIAMHHSVAYRCYKIKSVIETWTNFAKFGFDRRSHPEAVPVDETECLSMI